MARSRAFEVRLTGNAESLQRAFRAAETAAAKYGVDVDKSTGRAAVSVQRHSATQERALSGVTRRVKETHHEMLKLGVGLIGVGGVVSGLEKSAGAAFQAETAQVRLSVAVKDAGISWRGHREEIDKYLKRASATKGFIETDLSTAFARMVTTTGNVGKAQRLLNLAMDVSRARGISLAAAQQTLARVYNGSYLGLRRIGIAITPVTKNYDHLRETTKHATIEQTAHAKALDKEATVTAALGIVQRKYAGQATAYAKTGRGEYERFQATLHQVEATVGQALMPALTAAAGEGVKLADSFQKHWPEIKKDVNDVVQPVEAVGKGIASVVKHNPEVAKLAASVGIMALAAKKLGAFKLGGGLLRLLTGRGGGGGGLGGGVGNLLQKPVPVYVVGGRGLPGVPGGGPEPVPGPGSKLGGLARRFAPFILPVSVAAIGFKHLNDSLDLSDKKVDTFRKTLDRMKTSGRLSDRQLQGLASDFDRYSKMGGPWSKAFRQVGDAAYSATTRSKRSFDSMQHGIDRSMSTIAHDVNASGGHMRASLSSNTDRARKNATGDFNSISNAVTGAMRSVANTVDRQGGHARDSISSNTGKAKNAATGNFNRLGSNVSGAMNKLTGNIFSTYSWIEAQTQQTLSGLGAGTVKFSLSRAKALRGFPHQRGGRFADGGWLGARGMVSGVDNIPLGGGNMAAAGEAVVNRWQAPAVEEGMALANAVTGGAYPFRSLDDVFARIQRPHGMQKGGRFQRGGRGFQGGGSLVHDRNHLFTLPQLAGLWVTAGGPRSMASTMAHVASWESDAGRYGNPLAYNASGATGLWQILGALVPGDLRDPLVNARNAVAKWRTQGLSAWDASRSRWAPSLGQIVSPSGMSSDIARTLWKGGPPTLRRIGQAATDKVTKAANARISRALAASASLVGTPGCPAGTSVYKGKRMATWVAQALRYAAAHGSGDPQPTSGYRPGFDPHTATGTSEHQGTQYPHGAVDFGGMVDPAAYPKKMAVVNATRGYRYPLLAPIGFRDDGHASGTGHQRGGWAYKYDPYKHRYRLFHSPKGYANTIKAWRKAHPHTPLPTDPTTRGANLPVHYDLLTGRRRRMSNDTWLQLEHMWFAKHPNAPYPTHTTAAARSFLITHEPPMPGPGPNTGPSIGEALAEAQYDVSLASLTGRTDDDITAEGELVGAERDELHLQRAQLATVNHRLRGRLSPQDRARLLKRRAALRQAVEGTASSLVSDRGTLRDLKGGDTAADLVTAIKDLKASIDAQTKLARDDSGVIAREALRALADRTLGFAASQTAARSRGSVGYGTVMAS
jgi:hypothetical protein